jgi:hypothetical protein
MTLAETLLQKLNDWQPAGEGRPAGSFALPGHGWTVRVEAERVDSLGAVLTAVEAVRDVPVADDAKLLEAHARQAAARVSGLREKLCFVEIDRANNVALLRSDVPQSKDENVLYYEARYQGRNRVKFQRFQATKASPAGREAVGFVLTHETLARLVDDLVRD